VLDWLAARGVCSGHPEFFKEEFMELQVRKVVSERTENSKKEANSLQRRLAKRLTINY
jgi:hypothetical protein